MIYGKDGGETLMGADQCMESVRHQGGEKWERTVKGAVFFLSRSREGRNGGREMKSL